ncbi:MAG TPA: AAA family ATPase [Ignavibacteriaceae bacterium]|nr:AAA family ATPase [Ignavibacteriaceae bacterium]
MYLSKVKIKNIRCFENIEIDFDSISNNPDWTMIVGDNATGKTALLKSIAIGLCDVSSAAGLLRESDSGYIRHGKNIGNIFIELKDPTTSRVYKILTTLEKVAIRTSSSRTDYYERVSQKTNPNYQKFPWGKLFACAYGAGRGTSGSGDIVGYSIINAVYNLFNYSEGLQNPELMIRRFGVNSPRIKKEYFSILESILFEPIKLKKKPRVSLNQTGILIGGLWEINMPLRDIADGYKSTFLWVTDFLGWVLSFNPQISTLGDINGIVIIDELEEHLHPKWQKRIVGCLKKVFPHIQFITTTHSPLIASSILKRSNRDENYRLLHLELNKNNKVKKTELSNEVSGLDIDQLLGSKIFDYVTTYDSEVAHVFEVASKLASISNRNQVQEDNYQKLKKFIKRYIDNDGTTLIEQIIKDERFQEIKNKVNELEKALFEK